MPFAIQLRSLLISKCSVEVSCTYPVNVFAKISSFKPPIRQEISFFRIPREQFCCRSILHIDRPLVPRNLQEEKDECDNSDGLKCMMFLDIMGVDTEKALRKNPSLRSTSLDRINDVINFLQDMGLTHQELGRIFDIHPTILSSSVEDDLMPVFKFLEDEIKLQERNYKKVMKRHPVLLALDVKDRLRPCFYFLRGLGFSHKSFSDGSNLVLLGFHVERCLLPKLEFLQSLGLSYEEAATLAIRAPGIFTYSIENNMKPKYEYLTEEMGKGLQDLMDFPQYFSFSLDKRIKVRHTLLLEHKLSMSLPDMLKPSNEKFMEKLYFHQYGINIG